MLNKTYIIIIFLFILLIIPSNISAAGSDEIFLYIGQDKPIQWNSWTREKRHSYLQSLGLYPVSGDNYAGEVRSLDTYFKLLGKPQPDNWDDMTFQERKIYLNEGGNEKDSTNNQSQINIDDLNNAFVENEENKKIPYEYFLIFGILLGSSLIIIAYKTD